MTFSRSATPSPAELDQLVGGACAQVGVPARHCRRLRHFANAVYLLEDVPLVIRVGYGDGAFDRAERAVVVANWLAQQGFPASEPAVVPIDSQPVRPAAPWEVAVTFWRYYPQPARASSVDFEVLGQVAGRLHGVNAAPPVSLPRFTPLHSIRQAVEHALAAAGTIDQSGLRWLSGRIDSLLDEYQHLEFPLGMGLIHADMYVGNLLWSAGRTRAVLGDWDSVCIGPREIDLAPAFTATRFGLEVASVDQFALTYGYDLRKWSGYPTLRAIREVSTLTALVRLAPTDQPSANELRHRLTTLRASDSHAIWTRQ